MVAPGGAASRGGGGGGGGDGPSAGGNGCGCGGGGSRRMVMRTGVQTPALPLGTSVLSLCAGGSQRAASAASCGWCGSICRAWMAKGNAHGNFGQAPEGHCRRRLSSAPERRELSCLAKTPKAWRTRRSGPPEWRAATWAAAATLTQLSRLDAGAMGRLVVTALEERSGQPEVRLHKPGTQPQRPPCIRLGGYGVAELEQRRRHRLQSCRWSSAVPSSRSCVKRAAAVS